jgi:uncharacterized protein YecE (DUF72 family)
VDPFQSLPVYGSTLYWRLHGRSGYRYRYTEEDLGELRSKLDASAVVPGRNFVMFNNIYSTEDALRFLSNSPQTGKG